MAGRMVKGSPGLTSTVKDNASRRCIDRVVTCLGPAYQHRKTWRQGASRVPDNRANGAQAHAAGCRKSGSATSTPFGKEGTS